MEQGRSYRIETFDPLLRDLAAWGLVERSPTAERPAWHLSAEAQRRLDELVRPAEPLSVERLVYLDHLCAGCHQRGPTRLRQGAYLCDDCAQRHVVVDVSPVEPEQPGSGGRRPRRLRHRPEAGPTTTPADTSKPLAG